MTDRDWLAPVTAIVAFQMFLWWLTYAAGLTLFPEISTHLRLALAFFVFVALVNAFLFTLSNREQPFARITEAVMASGDRIVTTLIGIPILALGSASFAALKAGIPKLMPYWFDGPLMSVEGIAPWRASQTLFGWATPAIDALYATFLPVHMVAVLAALSMRPSPLKAQALISLALTWLILGVFCAYLFSSMGPIFVEPVVSETLRPSAPLATRWADWLRVAQQNDVSLAVNGISAMPSMHVALTYWLVLLVRRSRLAPFAWAYFGLILLGSIHLGWHYASDGLVAVLGVAVIWRSSTSFTLRR